MGKQGPGGDSLLNCGAVDDSRAIELQPDRMRMAADGAIFGEDLLLSIRDVDGDHDLLATHIAQVGGFVHRKIILESDTAQVFPAG